MPIIDTHCHYNLDPLYENWEGHWQKAQENGVVGSLVIGTDASSITKGLTLIEDEPTLFMAIGIHPTRYNDLDNLAPLTDTIRTDNNLLKGHISHPKVIAIGEVGLDYYRVSAEDRGDVRRIQKKALSYFCKLAKEADLPLILHVRDVVETAYWDLLEVLGSHYHGAQQPFILHCASGPIGYIRKALDMGAYLGIAGNITYKNAEYLRDLIGKVPVDRLLIETDAPFLPPQEFRGKTCEPWMISRTSQYLETELKIPQEQLLENTYTVFPELKLANNYSD